MVNYDGVSLADAYECVGEGWHPLVKRLYEAADKLDPKIKIVQVKEKFGRLRVYWDSPERKKSDNQNLLPFCDVVNEAERESGVTCEVCGKPGKVNDNGLGWLLAQCDEHKGHTI